MAETIATFRDERVSRSIFCGDQPKSGFNLEVTCRCQRFRSWRRPSPFCFMTQPVFNERAHFAAVLMRRSCKSDRFMHGIRAKVMTVDGSIH